ncbi:MAG: glycosyltransferase family 4 protein [Spirochaetales bacterium]|nr:glycosyltransferase family 4 protein [Spirochaetales bacterium]
MKTLIVQNYWTPYRHDLFTELSKYSDIEVLYLDSVGADRNWEKEETLFPSIQLKARKKGPFAFSDLSGIDFSRYDRAVILEHLENIFTIRKLARIFKGRFILWCGMSKDAHPDKPGYDFLLDCFKAWYRRRLYQANMFFSYCGMTSEMLIEWGVPEEKIHIIHQASSIREIPEIVGKDPVKLHRQSREAKPGPLRILSLGYLRKEKNNDFLIKVCNRFKSDELELVVAGSGPELEDLQQMAGDNVLFPGYLEGEDKFREYLKADVFVLPTIRDPWALVVNEAMYYGLPVICSNRAGARDVVLGNGFIINPFDEEDLYLALKEFVNRPELCWKMGRRSREIVQDYTVPFTAKQMSEYLNQENL